MNFSRINKFLLKISRFSGIVLFFLFLLFIVSGYAQTKGIFNPILAKKIHNLWLPIPTFIIFLLHSLIEFKFILVRLKLKDDFFLNLLILGVGLILLFIFLYFYLL